MKVTGPGSGGGDAIPDAAAPGESQSKVDHSPGAAGARFSDELDDGVVGGLSATRVEAARASGEAARAGAVEGLTAGLAADLRAGKLDPTAVVHRLVERVVDAQVGPDAPAAVREKLRAALQETLEGDPFVAEKLRQLR
jgi:hypothetical protein